jgi:S-adenosylmethionine:tRNA ribosyltransferase-isomerase
VHANPETHFALLGAFAPRALLGAALAAAEAGGFLTHELGDAMLILPGAIASRERGAAAASRSSGPAAGEAHPISG